MLGCWLHVWPASTETSQVEFSFYQKANERVQLGVLQTWPVDGGASAGTFALATKYTPSQESAIKVRLIYIRMFNVYILPQFIIAYHHL